MEGRVVSWGDPDAGGGWIGVGFDVVGGEGVDDGLFEGADVIMNSHFGSIEVDDGVGDELARAVVGDIAASVCLVELHAHGSELGLGSDHMLRGVWAAGDGDDRWVLDHQYPSELGIVGFSGVEDLGVVEHLELVGLFIAKILKWNEREGVHGGVYPVEGLIDL